MTRAQPSEVGKAASAAGARSEAQPSEVGKAASTAGARSEQGRPCRPRSEAQPSEGRTGAQPSEVGKVWTVLDLLRWTTEHFRARGLETPRLDAECLLAHALGVERLRLYLDFEKPVVEAERAVFRGLVRRRLSERVPVAQLLGRREFWSLPLRVTPEVLVPRPETETLVAALLERLPDPHARLRLADLGTGSGAVALALALERPRSLVVASDRVQAALNLAQQNAETLGMERRIRFLRGDWGSALAGGFDGVAANPPYLASSQRGRLAPELAHEPEGALFAGPVGTEALERLAREVPGLLVPGGCLAFELAPGQETAVRGWLAAAGMIDVRVHRDLAGRPRVVSASAAGARSEAQPSGVESASAAGARSEAQPSGVESASAAGARARARRG